MRNNYFYTIDDSNSIEELREIENKIKDELNAEKVDDKKVYELRFQQLMRGLYLTQNNGIF